MPIQKDSLALDKSARPLNKSELGASDTKNPRQKIEVSQAENLPAHVIAAKRELLRDYGHEVAIQAADFAGIVANFISADDKPGLQYATAKFVAFARETAKTCRELIDGGGR
jgi:hypothetical protein